MITGEIIKGNDLGARFAKADAFMNNAIQTAVMRLALKVTNRTKRKLSGEVLRVRTGRLRRSIHPEYDFSATQAIAAVGTNVEYAKIHEFGGTIKRHARSSYLYFKADREGNISNRFVKKSKSNFAQRVTYKEHEYRMPARPFLRPSLRELAPEIRAEIQQAANKALRDIMKGGAL